MKNEIYAEEIEAAKIFIKEKNESRFDGFLDKMKNPCLTHSDRWGMIYDFVSENYIDTTHVTGITYFIEENM